MRYPVLLVGAFALTLATPAAAQLQSTGIGAGLGTASSFWTAGWTGVCNSSYGGAAPVGGSSPLQCGTSSGSGAAYIVDDVAGAWQPQNDALPPRWISAWTNSSSTCKDGPWGSIVACDAANPFAAHYGYSYSTSFVSGSAGNVYFALGWDNILTGFTVNGSAYSLGSALVSSLSYPFADRYGFCRDGDAMFATANYAGGNCVARFRIPVLAGANTFAISTLGDGQTDGLFLAVEGGGRSQDVVPEPATMTLLATGLLGMAGSSIRRRRKNPKA